LPIHVVFYSLHRENGPILTKTHLLLNIIRLHGEHSRYNEIQQSAVWLAL